MDKGTFARDTHGLQMSPLNVSKSEASRFNRARHEEDGGFPNDGVPALRSLHGEGGPPSLYTAPHHTITGAWP